MSIKREESSSQGKDIEQIKQSEAGRVKRLTQTFEDITLQKTQIHPNKRKSGFFSHAQAPVGSYSQRLDIDIPKLREIFGTLINLLQREEFDEDMKSELECIFPNYLKMLEERICDLDREDNGIVVAGETSSGKSTLINTLIGENILKSRTTENTATICRNWNSENIGLKVYNEKYECIHSKQDYTKEQLSDFRKEVQKFTDVGSMPNDCSFVDILFPVSLLKGKTILVDTPGVGGSKRLAELMMKYLQNAVAFVFVVNASNAGGLQDDRLPIILREILHYHSANKMPCFDPSDVIFVTNKWDVIFSSCEEDSDEDDITLTWEKVKASIKKHWGSVKDEQIFQISLKKMKEAANNQFKTEYVRFEEKLKEIIDRNHVSRKQKHLRFLDNILRVLQRVTCGRILSSKLSEVDHQKLAEKNNQTMEDLVRKKEQINKDLRSQLDSYICSLSDELMYYVCSVEGKTQILTPPGKKDIKEVHVFALERKVKERYICFLENWRQSPEVICVFQDLEQQIKDSFSTLKGKIEELEKELMGSQYSPPNKDITTSPGWFPVLDIAGTLSTIAGVVLSSLFSSDFQDERKSTVIDKMYEKCVRIYDKETVKNDLENIYGNHYRNVIEWMLDGSIGDDIRSLKKTVLQVYEKRNEYKAKHEKYQIFKEALKDLKLQIKETNDDIAKVLETTRL
ncbi:transmembrane GTPase Marf-like isoform X2 [Saccostrea cucullata]|uniref:transmembrane GTPase Marf-like isoform X2 n=1 Tax=Saccostrea cuccullata TaxID=36930 RepID=UPI002ED26934